MKWDRDHVSPDLEDRRDQSGPDVETAGFSGGGGGGGAGIGLLFSVLARFGWRGILVGVVIVGVGYFALPLLGSGGPHTAPPPSQSTRLHNSVAPAPANRAHDDELAHLTEDVFDDVQASWQKRIPGFTHAKLVLFRGSVASACGRTSAAVGPFYCPGDSKVYIDLSFYDELRTKLGAPGEFAEAYVVAHELGHHVQNLRGLFGKFDSVHTELQADCLAGAWAKDANARGKLDVGDIDSAMNAAKQIGDDTLQREAGRTVRPETFTHGSSAQRQHAFNTGFTAGDGACDAIATAR